MKIRLVMASPSGPELVLDEFRAADRAPLSARGTRARSAPVGEVRDYGGEIAQRHSFPPLQTIMAKREEMMCAKRHSFDCHTSLS
jgi:hypothetical protein